MANAFYRQLPTGEYMRQDGGGPVFFKIGRDATDTNWYPQFSYDGLNFLYFVSAVPATTPALAQAALDAYVTKLNAGTA